MVHELLPCYIRVWDNTELLNPSSYIVVNSQYIWNQSCSLHWPVWSKVSPCAALKFRDAHELCTKQHEMNSQVNGQPWEGALELPGSCQSSDQPYNLFNVIAISYTDFKVSFAFKRKEIQPKAFVSRVPEDLIYQNSGSFSVSCIMRHMCRVTHFYSLSQHYVQLEVIYRPHIALL